MDEDALVDALNSGRVLSVGLDVYQQEPNIHPGLVSNPHVCLLPHMGTSTVEVIPSSAIGRTQDNIADGLTRPRRGWRNGQSATFSRR